MNETSQQRGSNVRVNPFREYLLWWKNKGRFQYPDWGIQMRRPSQNPHMKDVAKASGDTLKRKAVDENRKMLTEKKQVPFPGPYPDGRKVT